MKKTYECGLHHCHIDLGMLIRTVDDGEKLIAFCPNDEVIHTVSRLRGVHYEVETHPSQLNGRKIECEICKGTHEFEPSDDNKSILYTINDTGETNIELELCQKHLERLVLLDLKPKDYFILRNNHGIFHQIHDDFYDEEDGYAIQPRKI